MTRGMIRRRHKNQAYVGQRVTPAVDGKFKSVQDYGNTLQDPDTADSTCRICGLPKKQWPDAAGYVKNGEIYCCGGCVEGTGCSCMSDRKKQHLMEVEAGVRQRR